MRRRLTAGALAGTVAVLTACASSGALEQTERTLMAELQALQASQDSLRVELRRTRGTLLDSLQASRGRELAGRGELGRRLDRIEEELGQISALVGATQRQMTRLREGLGGASGGRSAGPGGARTPADTVAGDTVGSAPDSAAAGEAEPGELYEASLQQFRRGAYGTARSGLQEFLARFPDHELAPDAQFYVAETWAEADQPERALEAYGRVVELFPDSRRAAAALYKSGRIELERGNTEDARVFFSRVVEGYPDSPEASLASDRLESLGGGG